MSTSAAETARLDRSQVTGVYTRLAPMYDLWAGLTEARARRACLERAHVRDGESVLEVAVGTGLTFAEILRANPSGRNVGIDLTPAMLERARSRIARLPGGDRAELSVGDAYALPFPDATFDLVVNNYMFDLLPEDDFATVLAGFRRVLRPGGRLVLVNMTRGEGLAQRFYDWVYQVRPALIGGCRGVFLEPHLRAAGLERIERGTVMQWGFSSEVLSATAPAAGAAA